jgi:hypothetical protein
MENKEEIKEEKLGKAPEQEIRVWGLGVLLNKFDKLLEKVEKIDKKLFFMEKRQQQWFEKIYPEEKKTY